MKHIKTFEGYVSGLQEALNSKAKQLQSKFKDAITVDQFSEGWDDEEEEAARVNNAMQRLKTDAATTLFASNANDEDGYERFVAQVYKSGLKYEEAETPDGVQEIYIAANESHRYFLNENSHLNHPKMPKFIKRVIELLAANIDDEGISKSEANDWFKENGEIAIDSIIEGLGEDDDFLSLDLSAISAKDIIEEVKAACMKKRIWG